MISAENQSAEINLKAYREEVCLIVSLQAVIENLNLVKSYDRTNPNDFVFNLWEKYRWGFTSFDQYMFLPFLQRVIIIVTSSLLPWKMKPF